MNCNNEMNLKRTKIYNKIKSWVYGKKPGGNVHAPFSVLFVWTISSFIVDVSISGNINVLFHLKIV